MNDFIVFGHRGASGYEPENTLRSFETAINLGCTWIELDVYLVEDEIIVIHAENLSRTTNGQGRISDVTLDYVRSLDAGKGEPVPTLNEVLELAKGRCGINVELKGPRTAKSVSSALHKACQAGWHPDQLLISSFDHDELALADPAFRRGALFDRQTGSYVVQAKAVKAYSIHLALRLVDARTVARAHDEGFKVFVYTVNDINGVSDMDVDGVFTDFPDRIIKQLSAR